MTDGYNSKQIVDYANGDIIDHGPFIETGSWTATEDCWLVYFYCTTTDRYPLKINGVNCASADSTGGYYYKSFAGPIYAGDVVSDCGMSASQIKAYRYKSF